MRSARPSGQLGDSRVANLKDLSAAGLLDPGGLFFGALEGRLLFFNRDGPILTYRATGGGKGRDLILPNLAHVRGRSLIVIDVKDGENAFASARYRRDHLGHKCIYLNPFGLPGFPNTRVNPLQSLIEIVNAGKRIDTEATDAAQTLIPKSSKSSDKWVRDGAVRVLTLPMEFNAHFDPDACTLGGLWRFVNSGSSEIEMALAMMKTCGIESIEKRASVVERVMTNAPRQFEAYINEAIEAVTLFEPGKALEAATSVNEFDFAALKHEPHTLFLMAPSDKLEVVAPWISLTIAHSIEKIAKERGPIRTTIFLDEFPQLPASPSILKALRLYREKGIQLWMFAQGPNSLADRWPKEIVKEFEDQAAMMTMAGVQDPELIRNIELWSGNETILQRGVSHNGGTVETAAANLGETKRPVLQSEDIFRLVDENKQIVKIRNMSRLIVPQSVGWFDVAPWKDVLRDVRKLHRGEETEDMTF